MYDVLSVCLLVTDFTAVPYLVAFSIPIHGAVLVLIILSAAFWTLDMAVNFNTPYLRQGVWVRDRRGIAMIYLRSYFSVDLSIVCIDWVSICLAVRALDSVSEVKMLRLAKISRLLRVFGLLRCLHIARRFEDLVEKHFSEGFQAVVRLFCALLSVLWLNHVIGCIWYYIGTQGPEESDRTWLDAPSLAGSSAGYLYVTSVHFAIAQLTLGSTDVNTANVTERIFTVLLLLLGLIFSAVLVSHLSAMFITFQLRSQQRTTRLYELRKYLRQHSLDSQLVMQVRQQAELVSQKASMLVDDDVEALCILSPDMRAELRLNILGRHLVHHPLFGLWHLLAGKELFDSLLTCCKLTFKEARDTLFMPGAAANCVWVLVSGVMEYTQEPHTSFVTARTCARVSEGSWLSEAALWVSWLHVGTATATSHCRLITLDVEDMLTVFQSHTLLHEIVLEYSKQYYYRVESCTNPFPSDIYVPMTTFRDVLAAMRPTVQKGVGLQILRATWSRINRRHMGNLENQVMSGAGVISFGCTGDPQLLTSKVSLRLEQCGLVLMELGRCVSGRGEVVCDTPFIPQLTHMSVSEAIDTLLQRLHGLFKDPLDCEFSHVEVSEAKNLGIISESVDLVHTCSCEGNELHANGLKLRHLRYSSSSLSTSWILGGDMSPQRYTLKEATTSSLFRSSDNLPLLDLLQQLTIYGKPLPGDEQHTNCFFAWVEERVLEQLRKQASSITVLRALEALDQQMSRLTTWTDAEQGSLRLSNSEDL